MDIEILDCCDCKIPIALANIVKPAVSFPAVYYQQGPYRKIRKEYMKSVMTKGTNCYYLPTGLLQRVVDYCKERDVNVNIVGKTEKLNTTKKPSLKGITLREEQIRLVNKAIKD